MVDGYAFPSGLCWVMNLLMDNEMAVSGAWMCDSFWTLFPGIIEK